MIALSRDRWSLNYDCIEGGLVVQDAKHDAFNLARDIRVVRVWVDTDPPAASNGSNRKSYVLNSADMPKTSGPDVQDAPAALDNPSQFFQSYRSLFALSASHASRVPYLAGSPNEVTVKIDQRFLFGNYGKNPAHEPGGVLDATRMFPMTRFAFPAVKDKNKPYPKYVRIDYRLDIDLDNITKPDAAAARNLGKDTVTNKAGVFRDDEHLPNMLLSALRTVADLMNQVEDVGAFFAALEKPMPHEMASHGLVAGAPVAGVSKQATWDNIHIWPARQAVSTPGAFHAFHCHWRWGASAGDSSERGQLLPAAGDPQFRGLGWMKSEGGPLLSAQLPRQNLQFAVTKNSPEWAKDKNPSEWPFAKLFTDVRARPEPIAQGNDLVLWVSFEVFRDETALDQEWAGPVFVNGFYFGHNADQTPKPVALGGAFGEKVVSTNHGQWQRLAK